MPDLHHLLPLLKITPTRALGNDETPRRASERTVEDVLEEYRVFSRRRIPADRESAEYFRFDEDLSVMLYRLRQFVDTSMLDSLEDMLFEAIGQLEEIARVLSGVDSRRKARAPPADDDETQSPESTQPPANAQPPTPDSTGEIIGQKRQRGIVFDAYDDPETALANWNRMAPMLSPADRDHAQEMLHTFVQDQAEVSVVVVDCETQTLISDDVPIPEMLLSVSVALLLPASTLSTSNATRIVAWPSEIPRGCAYEFLHAALDHAARIVAHYGSGFDLPLLARGDQARLARWKAKLHDPYSLLRGIGERGIGLGALLRLNSLGDKIGSGSDAPELFHQGRYQELENYCANDVIRLTDLVLKPEIQVPSGRTTSIVSLRSVAAAPAPAAATQELTQQSEVWFQARKDKVTASAAAGLLSLSPFSTRQSSFERLVLNARSAPTAAMQRGIDEESGIADLYVRAFPQAVLQSTGLWVHPEHAWLVASPDRLLGEHGLLEVKRFRRLAKPGPSVLIQVLLQLECTSRRFCDIIQYDGARARVDRVERDRELQEDLIELLRPVYEAANAARAGGSRMAPELNVRDWEELKAGLRGLYVRRRV